MSTTENETTDTTTEVTAEVQATDKQETFDREYVETLRKEAAKHRTEAKAAVDRLAEFEAKHSTFTEEAGTKEAAANAAIEKANLENTRLKVAIKHGIASEDIDLFLTGDTEEFLTQQAEALSKRSGQSVKPDPAQGKRTGGPTSKKAIFDDFWDSRPKN